MTKINIVMCGKVRDLESFNYQLSRCLQWRDEGLVDRIVFSGWASDLRLHGALLSQLSKQRVESVFTPEPDLVIYGHALHQKKNLYYGLSFFGDDDVVLKTRTDRVDTHFDLASSIRRFHESDAPSHDSPYSRKVMVQYYSPFQPYFLGDQVFLGCKRDLMKMTTFDLWFLADQAFLNPEQIIHVSAFIDRRPNLRDFFRINPGLIYNDVKKSEKLYGMMLKHEFYIGAVYTGLRDALGSFIVGFEKFGQTLEPLNWPKTATLTSLTGPVGAGICNGLNFNDNAATINTGRSEPLTKLLDIPISTREKRNLAQIAAGSDWTRLGLDAPVSALLNPLAEKLGEAIKSGFTEVPHTTAPPVRVAGSLIYNTGYPMVRGAT